MTLPARIDSIPAATAFVEETLEDAGCPMKVLIRINIAIDELFSNIARYAYQGGEGNATLLLDAQEGRMTLTFADAGVPYNPLTLDEPDVHAALDERKEGGLGIFLVRKTMDEMTYEYRDGLNRLTIVKTW